MTAHLVTQRSLDLIKDKIEDLKISETDERTGSSDHSSRFVGYMGLWSSFESGVRQNTTSINWNQHQNILQVLPPHPNGVHHEHYICGSESSVTARLIQNIFQPLTAVSKELGQGIHWGDGKISDQGKQETKKLPDFVAVANGRHLRLVGEVKTPWAHALAEDVRDVMSSDDLWRRFGQIAGYMQRFRVKYGVFTTYDTTVFLKQELRDNKWVLWHSRPIENLTPSSGFGGDPADLVGKVSVRECFLYLQTRIKDGDWEARQNYRPWCEGTRRGPIDFGKYYENDKPGTKLKDPGPPIPPVPSQHDTRSRQSEAYGRKAPSERREVSRYRSDVSKKNGQSQQQPNRSQTQTQPSKVRTQQQFSRNTRVQPGTEPAIRTSEKSSPRPAARASNGIRAEGYREQAPPPRRYAVPR